MVYYQYQDLPIPKRYRRHFHLIQEMFRFLKFGLMQHHHQQM
jgi:hypothetical protein